MRTPPSKTQEDLPPATTSTRFSSPPQIHREEGEIDSDDDNVPLARTFTLIKEKKKTSDPAKKLQDVALKLIPAGVNEDCRFVLFHTLTSMLTRISDIVSNASRPAEFIELPHRFRDPIIGAKSMGADLSSFDSLMERLVKHGEEWMRMKAVAEPRVDELLRSWRKKGLLPKEK